MRTPKISNGGLLRVLATFGIVLAVLFFAQASVWAESNDGPDSITLSESEGSVGYQYSHEHAGQYGTTRVDAQAGASGSYTASISEDGVAMEAEGAVGLALELEAISEKLTVGNEHVELSAQGEAQLNALLGAEGKVKAYIDENGITIGAEAQAGAFVSASAAVTFGAKVMGVDTTVRVYGEAHAGALARGTANVTIGFDGRIKFELGAGLAVGVGASVGMAFDVDASELMNQLGLDNLEELIDWIERFVEDPQELIGELTDELVDHAWENRWEIADWAYEKAWDGLEGIHERGRDLYDYVDRFIDRNIPSDMLENLIPRVQPPALPGWPSWHPDPVTGFDLTPVDVPLGPSSTPPSGRTGGRPEPVPVRQLR